MIHYCYSTVKWLWQKGQTRSFSEILWPHFEQIVCSEGMTPRVKEDVLLPVFLP